MKIRPSLVPIPRSEGPSPPALLRDLRSGQELQARVLDVPRPGIARLQIGLTELLARTRLPVEPGAQLRLSVRRLRPLPELKVLEQTPTPTGAQAAVLRAALPRQVPLSEVLQSLSRVLAEQPEAFSPEARRMGARLLERLLPPHRLDGNRIRERFLGSGLFLEARLATGEMPADDLKLQLLQLFRLITTRREGQQPQPGDGPHGSSQPPAERSATAKAAPLALERLIALLQGGVARLQTHQGSCLPADGPERPAWQFELPVLVAGQPQEVLIRIDKDPAPDGEAAATPEAQWTVTLRFDLGDMGGVQAKITVSGERVSSVFWCERAETSERFAAGLPLLEEALRAAGLEVGGLRALAGAPPAVLELPRPLQGLVDTRA